MKAPCWCCGAVGHCFCSRCEVCGGCAKHLVEEREIRSPLFPPVPNAAIIEMKTIHPCVLPS